jgi:hypothetical protein
VELAGDTGAAFAVWVSAGMVIIEINARAAMNFFMTHLLATEYCHCLLQRRDGSPCLAVIEEIGLWNDWISISLD